MCLNSSPRVRSGVIGIEEGEVWKKREIRTLSLHTHMLTDFLTPEN